VTELWAKDEKRGGGENRKRQSVAFDHENGEWTQREQGGSQPVPPPNHYDGLVETVLPSTTQLSNGNQGGECGTREFCTRHEHEPRGLWLGRWWRERASIGSPLRRATRVGSLKGALGSSLEDMEKRGAHAVIDADPYLTIIGGKLRKR
jgi:hypothetical protein